MKMITGAQKRAARRGQSIFEYMLVLAVVIGAIAAAAAALLKPAVEKNMTDSKGVIESSSGKLSASVLQ